MDILWLIDTRKFDSIEEKMYGWTVSEKNELLFNDFPENFDGTGSYTYIKKKDFNTIEIGQDFLATQGIFVYCQDTFFIASNSFFKLFEYLYQSGIKMSLNKRFSIQYLYCNEEPFTFGNTLVNEINLIPSQFTLRVDRFGVVGYCKNEYNVSKYSFNTKEGQDIIDKWYEKWVEVMRNTAKKDNTILLDLSGGFDSRITFGMFNSANINKKRPIIHCHVPEYSKYSKSKYDWDISQTILKNYDYTQINSEFYETKVNADTLEKDCESTFLGNSKVCDYNGYTFDKPIIHLTGEYGGRVHGSFPFTPAQWIDHVYQKFEQFYTDEYTDVFFEENAKALETASNVYGIQDKVEDLGDFLNLFYNRFYGKKMLFKMLHNDIYISPFMDPMIHSLKNKLDDLDIKYQLSSFIMVRYFTELVNYGFEGGRTVSDRVKTILWDINKKSPYKRKEYEYIGKEWDGKKCVRETYDLSMTVNNYLIYLEKNKELLLDEFNEELVNYASMIDIKSVNTQNFFTPFISICKVLEKIK